MRPHLVSKSTIAILFLCVSFASAQESRQLRIVRPIDNRDVVRLQGTVHPRASSELDQGPVSPKLALQHMTLAFQPMAAQQAALKGLLAAQLDRSSPDYHKWLTPEEYGDRFGLNEIDANTVATWLRSQGFTVEEIARSRTWISFSGIAAQVEAAFHTSIHNYLVDGTLHYSPAAEPSIPAAFAGVVTAIGGLHDFRPQPRSRARRINPRLTSSISGNHFLVPGDFGTIYNLPDYVQGSFQPGNDGSGQSIAIVGQTRIVGSPNGPFTDIDTFRAVSNLPPTHLQTILAGTDPGLGATAEVEEANLDIEWAGAIAPNANIIFVYSTQALGTSLQYIVNNDVAPVISISYGGCEASMTSGSISLIEGYFQQANAQGQTIVAAAGDTGATDCDGTPQNPVTISTQGLAVDYPGSSAYVTGMGGTEFTGDDPANVTSTGAAATQYWNGSNDPNDTSASAFAYIPEQAWNDTPLFGMNIGTGGGVSKQFAKPSWQTGIGVPQDGQRDVPDLALASSPNHDGYIICSQGSCQTGHRQNSDQTFTLIGGTSVAAPAFAGIVALANQRLGVRQGNLNPDLYSLAATSSWAFNDVVNGDNKVPCQAGTPDCPNGGTIGFSAGTGYDLVTGWGSVDATGLIDALSGTQNPNFYLLPMSPTLNANFDSSASTQVTVFSREGFTANASFSCSMSSALSGTTCSVSPTTGVAPGQSTTLTIGPSNSGLLGTLTGTATVTGTSGSLTQTASITATVNYPDFLLTPNSSSENVPVGGTISDVFNLISNLGFSGTVSFSCTGTTGLTCSVTTNPVTVDPLRGATPAFTLTASPTASSGSITITGCAVSPSLGATTCSLNPTTISTAGTPSTLTVQAAVLAKDRSAPLPFSHRGMGAYASFVFAFGMVLVPISDCRIRRTKRSNWIALVSLFVLSILLLSVSCGGGGATSTPSAPTRTPLSGTVTVTGTNVDFTHSISIPVTIN